MRKKKVYIYFFGLAVTGTNETKKKKFCAGDWIGYCPFSSLSHNTMDCIVTQGTGACSRVATTRPRGPTTQPHDTASKGSDTVGLRIGASDAHIAWPGVSRDTKIISWLGRPFVSQYGATELRYSAATRQ